jgi:hypothetical protein
VSLRVSRRSAFLAGAACALSFGEGCVLLVPETRDRVELATVQARDTCSPAVVDGGAEPSALELPIDRVEPFYSSVPSRSGYDQHFLGAKLRIRPTPGMTSELLERMLRCHAARQTLAANAGVTNDPYVLPDGWVKIRVESEDASFIVKLTSHDHAAAKQILARARSFVAAPRPSARADDAGAQQPHRP